MNSKSTVNVIINLRRHSGLRYVLLYRELQLTR